MVSKVGYVAKMAPLGQAMAPLHPIAKLVENLGDLAVRAISRLYSKQTVYPVFGHFKCLEGFHPC